jgi:hypothetical protein
MTVAPAIAPTANGTAIRARRGRPFGVLPVSLICAPLHVEKLWISPEKQRDLCET